MDAYKPKDLNRKSGADHDRGMGDEAVRSDGPGQRRSSRRRRVGATVGALVVVGILAAACSNGPKSPGAAAGGSSSGNMSGLNMAGLLAYAKCMRSHGISDFPDPSGGGISLHGGPGSDLNRSNPRFEAAHQACQSLLPGGSGTPTQSPQKIAEEEKLAACMRGHGFPSFPDPNSQGAFNFNGIDRSSAQFQSAFSTCESEAGFSGPLPVESSPGGNGS
jgi:hypothetical protein